MGEIYLKIWKTIFWMLNALKFASKKAVYTEAEATCEFIGNEIADKIVKPDENLRDVEEIIVTPEKR